ncbi:MAG: transporter substrate-binding domain-containing protein [Lachnospiraceae bacterium]|nr:transporter substrate-binding domain-containing protein [Lachnospiraceae bacterium]
MNKNVLKRLVILIAIAALSAGALAGCGKDKAGKDAIVIHGATTGALAPYSYYDENNKLVGYDVELVEAVFAKLPQYKLDWETVEHASIWAGLDSGRYQIGANNYGYTDERAEKYIISEPTMTSKELVIANKSIDLGSGETVRFEDLVSYGFVGSAGINHTLLVENYNADHPDNQINITYVENDTQATLTGVETGRYGWTLYNAPFYVGYLQPSFGYQHNYKLLETDYATFTYALIAKDQTEFAEAFNKALKEVIAEGKAKELSIKYFGGDYAPSDK